MSKAKKPKGKKGGAKGIFYCFFKKTFLNKFM